MEKLVSLVRDEWLLLSVDDKGEAEAEILGLIQGMKKLHQEGLLTTGRLWVFERLRRIWPLASWAGVWDFASLLIIPPDKKGRISLSLPQGLLGLMTERFGRRTSWSWLRGLWGSCGSLYLPSSGYYCTFRLYQYSGIASRVEELLSQIRAKPAERKMRGWVEISIRSQVAITALLKQMKLTRSSLLLQERARMRAFRDRANKVVNCDAFNIQKSLRAAEEQSIIAQQLVESKAFHTLSRPLQELVMARLQNPSATLEELGRALSKPVTKSTVEYRWKKLKILAEITTASKT